MPAAPVTRQLVQRRAQPLTAWQVAETTQVELADGAPVTAHPGWWIISQGARSLAVVPPSHFVAQYEPIERARLTLSAETCTAIEAITGPGTTRSVGELLAAISRLAHIGIGQVEIKFTPGQLEELKHRAAKRDRSIEDELALVVDRIRDELFHRGP